MSEETQQGGAVATQQQPTTPRPKPAPKTKKEPSCLVTALIGIAVLVYFISPVDLLTDFVPGVGWFDDVFFTGWFIVWYIGRKYVIKAILFVIITLIMLCYPMFPWQIIADDVPTWGLVDNWAIGLWGAWRAIRCVRFFHNQVETAKDMVRRL